MICSAIWMDVAGGGGRPPSAIAQEPRRERRIVNTPLAGRSANVDVEFRDRLARVEVRNLLEALVLDYPAAGAVAKFVPSRIADVDGCRQQTHCSEAYGGLQRAAGKDVQR